MPSSKPDQQQNTDEPPSYKDQLDIQAYKARDPNYGKDQKESTLLEKVADYSPAVGKLLGVEKKEEEPARNTSPPGPPERPHHDVQVEEFLKDQHGSKKGKNGQLIV